MKLTDIKNGKLEEWKAAGYELPKFDIEAVREKTHQEPTWVHFGAGNQRKNWFNPTVPGRK